MTVNHRVGGSSPSSGAVLTERAVTTLHRCGSLVPHVTRQQSRPYLASLHVVHYFDETTIRMIRILGTVLFLGVFSSVAVGQQVVDQVPPAKNTDGYWPLVCKSGSSIRIEIQARINGSDSEAMITFGRGAMASGSNGENLAAGSCSWVDRGMGDSEPNMIVDSDLRTTGVSYVIGEDGWVASQRTNIDYNVLKSTARQVWYLFVQPSSNAFLPKHDPSSRRVLLTRVRN